MMYRYRELKMIGLGLVLVAVPALFALCAAGQANERGMVKHEYGVGLTVSEADNGWISLFDGQTAFGWTGAKVEKNGLSGGQTTARFGDCELRAEIVRSGTIQVGGKMIRVERGKFQKRVIGSSMPIVLADGLKFRTLILRPLGFEPIFNGKDLKSWRRHFPKNHKESDPPVWSVRNGLLCATSGPGALEYPRRYGDFALQLDIRTNTPFANGGVFFRNQPGVSLMGYEAQILNRSENNDPLHPTGYSTGAIDDRQPARRLVTRDGEFFKMTIVANGSHLATWANGYQLVDWQDTRPRHDNPRKGLRTEPGTIQLQSHDVGTDIEFKNIEIVRLPQELDQRDKDEITNTATD